MPDLKTYLDETQEMIFNHIASDFKDDTQQSIPDPFNLLESQTLEERTPPSDFRAFLQEFDQAKVEPFNTTDISISDPADDEVLLPKIIHTVWIGGVLKNKNRLNALKLWKENNPDYEVVLYTDQTDFYNQEGIELKNWCKANKIHLINPEPFFAHHPNFKCYKNEKLRKNFAGACDILRWMILERWNGIYTDLDNVCYKPLGDIYSEHEFLVASGLRQYTQRAHPLDRSAFPKDTEAFNNDLIYSFKTEVQTSNFINYMRQNYFKSFKELNSEYGKNQNYTDENTFKLYDTMARTGPTLLLHYISSVLQINARKLAIPIENEAIIFGNELSWLKNKRLNMQFDEKLIKEAITNLLNTLKREPGVIMLNDISINLTAEALIIVLEIIKEKHPEILKNNTIFLPYSDWFSSNLIFLKYMVNNPDIFSEKNFKEIFQNLRINSSNDLNKLLELNLDFQTLYPLINSHLIRSDFSLNTDLEYDEITKRLIDLTQKNNALEEIVKPLKNRPYITYLCRLIKLYFPSEISEKILNMLTIDDLEAIQKYSRIAKNKDYVTILDIVRSYQSILILEISIDDLHTIKQFIFSNYRSTENIENLNVIEENLSKLDFNTLNYLINQSSILDPKELLVKVYIKRLIIECNDLPQDNLQSYIIPLISKIKNNELLSNFYLELSGSEFYEIVSKDIKNKIDKEFKEQQNNILLETINSQQQRKFNDLDKNHQKLINQLQDYVTRIEKGFVSNKSFNFFSNTLFVNNRSLSRELNYYLAKALIDKLEKNESVEEIFSNVNTIRNDIMNNNKIKFGKGFVNVGIWSTQLNNIIKNAHKIIDKKEDESDHLLGNDHQLK